MAPAPSEPCGNEQELAGARVHGTPPFAYLKASPSPPLLTTRSLHHQNIPMRPQFLSITARARDRARAPPLRLAGVREVHASPYFFTPPLSYWTWLAAPTRHRKCHAGHLGALEHATVRSRTVATLCPTLPTTSGLPRAPADVPRRPQHATRSPPSSLLLTAPPR